ncbi:MAG: hypothetical protein ACRDLB_06805 [Actinomycetota bacterium]
MADATVVVQREKAWTDKARAYRILLDGAEVTRIRENQPQSFTVGPGRHELQLKIDWAMSPVLPFEVAEGDEVRFTCGPRGNPLSVLYYATVGRKSYIRLERV